MVIVLLKTYAVIRIQARKRSIITIRNGPPDKAEKTLFHSFMNLIIVLKGVKIR